MRDLLREVRDALERHAPVEPWVPDRDDDFGEHCIGCGNRGRHFEHHIGCRWRIDRELIGRIDAILRSPLTSPPS